MADVITSTPGPAAAEMLRAALCSDDPPPFALLHRPEQHGEQFELLIGSVHFPTGLDALEAEVADCAPGAEQVLALLPFRLIGERGYTCTDDRAPLVALRVNARALILRNTIMRTLPADAPIVTGGKFDLADEQYADMVRRVIADEIGQGTGANFVLRRNWSGQFSGWSVGRGLALFRQLILNEPSAYWSFYVYTGDNTFIGATPERHVSLRNGVVTMNPISGTYRHSQGPKLAEAMKFLGDKKEIDELFMVLDEELKMLGRLCPTGGCVRGPYLKQMASVSHTEYVIEGSTECGVADVLRETMWAPTVVGSPIESACRVVEQYEQTGRGYYSGAIVLAGRDTGGTPTLDSAILIRTAEISARGEARFGVGATLVRHSDPAAEVEETWAKAQALLRAFGAPGHGAGPHRPPAERPLQLAEDPEIRRVLRARNAAAGQFWFSAPGTRELHVTGLAGRRLLVVDAEDTFTAMGRSMLAALGLRVDVRRFDEPYAVGDYDIVVVGPGPGDPRDRRHPRIAHIHDLVEFLLDSQIPLLAVCLGHQILCSALGMTVFRKSTPHQGIQRTITYLNRKETVGFYNTYAASWPNETPLADRLDRPVEVFRDSSTGEVFGLRGPHFASMQFHPASILTHNGLTLLGETISGVLNDESSTATNASGSGAPVLERGNR